MNILVNRTALSAALDSAAQAADAKSTMPVLACANLTAKGKTLTVTGTDLNVTVTTEVPCDGDAGVAIVDAKDLAVLMARLPGSEVRLSLSGNVLTVKAKSTTHKLTTISPSSWNKTQGAPGKWQAVPGAEFAAGLRLCEPSVCRDLTRFHLNGMLLRGDGGRLRVISTDGHRMHAAERKMAATLPDMIVPEKATKAIARLVEDAGEVQVAHDGWHLVVRAGQATLWAKLIAATFPPFEQVVPDHEAAATVDRVALLEATKRAQLASSEAGGIRLTFGADQILVESENREGRASSETVEAESGAGATIGVNPKYLADALVALGGDAVSIRYGGELDPLIIHRADETANAGAGSLVVIMPMAVR